MALQWKDIQKQAEEDALYLEQTPDKFIKNDVKKAQKALFLLLISQIDDFETDESGRIKKSTKNFYKVNKVDGLFKKFKQTAGFILIGSLIEKLQKIASNSFKYFKSLLGSTDKFNATKGEVAAMFNERLGINEDGTLASEGFLATVFDDPTLKNRTREMFFRSVLAGDKPSDLRTTLEDFISPTKEDVQGEIEKFYSTLVGDAFSRIDRMASDRFAQSFDLTWFVYFGTIIKTSRQFCRKHINGIYNRTEAEHWIYEIPAPLGIPANIYDPIIDMGGRNCRHLPKFITDEMKDDLVKRGYSTVPSNL